MSQPVIAISMMHEVIDDHTSKDWVRTTYVEAVIAAGGIPILLPNSETSVLALEHCDGLILTGGGDVDPARYGQKDAGTEWSGVSPVRDETELHLLKHADRLEMPVFGICRGMQVMAVGYGGTLIQDLGRDDPKKNALHHQESARYTATHSISIQPDTYMADLVGKDSALVNSFHHQAVDQVPAGWTISSFSEDGVIESMERPGDVFRVGVQWHPEDLHGSQPESQSLFAAFLQAAMRYRSRRA